MEEEKVDVDVAQVAKETSILNIKEDPELSPLCAVNTPKDAKIIYENAPPNSETKAAALMRWSELSLQEIEKATTLDEFKAVFINAPREGETRDRILWRWHEITLQKAMEATNIEEAREAIDAALPGSAAEVEALKKWVRFVKHKGEEATTKKEKESVRFMRKQLFCKLGNLLCVLWERLVRIGRLLKKMA